MNECGCKGLNLINLQSIYYRTSLEVSNNCRFNDKVTCIIKLYYARNFLLD